MRELDYTLPFIPFGKGGFIIFNQLKQAIRIIRMTIAIDYDDTYTKAPYMWDKIIRVMKNHGCKVICVTARHDSMMEDVYNHLKGTIHKCRIYNTDHEFKRPFLQKKGIRVDIWIDDMPELINNSMIIK